jgi:hypothetical protein
MGVGANVAGGTVGRTDVGGRTVASGVGLCRCREVMIKPDSAAKTAMTATIIMRSTRR